MYEARQHKDKVSRRISNIGRTAIQRNFDEMGGNALFVSKNDEGKIGSIYFNKGRIRLIHPDGPKISLHKNMKRYVIEGDFSRFFKMFNKIKHHLTLSNIDGLIAGWSAKGVNPQILENGRLFEVFFENNGKCRSYHKSRGKVDEVPKEFNKMRQIGLYYVVKLSRTIAEHIINNVEDLSKEGILNFTENIKCENVHENVVLNAIKNNVPKFIDDIKNKLVSNKQHMLGYVANELVRRTYDFEGSGIEVHR